MNRVHVGLLAGLTLGVAVGVGAFTFVYAQGASYLTNDPAACGNCHIMEEHFAAWTKSSHRGVAVCNDCHTPKGVVAKYATKASNGFWHSFAFTTGRFPDPLRIKPGNHAITERACRKCHAEMAAAIDGGAHAGATGAAVALTAAEARMAEPTTCTRCHRHVGHWVR